MASELCANHDPNAGYVAYGSGRNTTYGRDLFISSTFGAAWGSPVATIAQRIFALAFASSSRLYVGTTGGQVYRLDRTGTTWGTPTRIDNVSPGGLPLAGLITDIEVDPADTTGSSVYITFGGVGDARHVWHYDGSQWADRSGTGANRLLDSSHNSIVADPANVTHLYVAADVGVWGSTDGGTTWQPVQNGLPDAAVFDLRLHPTTRLLRASTHGRGMFELAIDPPAQRDVELYVRDTALDVGRVATADGLPDPETWPAAQVVHYHSRNIKVDVPTPAGYQTPTNSIDFLQFNDVIVDGSQHVGTMDPAAGTVVNRVYVEVHNRGVVKADSAQVMLLLTRPAIALAPLPTGYEANVIAGTNVSDTNWQTVGIRTLTDLRSSFPQVAAFSLPSIMLPPPADLPARQHHCLVAFVHSAQDAYTSNDVLVDSLTVADRKVAQRNLQVVPFVGTPPPPQSSDTWVSADISGVDKRNDEVELLIDARAFRGQFALLLPDGVTSRGLKEIDHEPADEWAERHTKQLRTFIKQGRFSPVECRRMQADIKAASSWRLLGGGGGRKAPVVVRGLHVPYGKRVPLFLRIEPERMKPGAVQELRVFQYDPKSRRILGGNTWRIVAGEKNEGARKRGSRIRGSSPS